MNSQSRNRHRQLFTHAHDHDTLGLLLALQPALTTVCCLCHCLPLTAQVTSTPKTPAIQNSTAEEKKSSTYLFVNIVAAKLHSTVRHDPHAIRAIARHHTTPAFLAPHFAQRLANAHLVLLAPDILHLQQDFEALERRDDGAGDGARGAASDEGGDDDLREPGAEAVEGCGFDGGFFYGGGRRGCWWGLRRRHVGDGVRVGERVRDERCRGGGFGGAH
jgi:hypothetical protein